MCLFSNQKHPFIAKKDIICYKILNCVKNIRDNTTTYISPYYSYFKWFVNKPEKINLYVANNTGKTPEQKGGLTIINSGYFHTYEKKHVAQIVCNEMYDINAIVVECTIPKGTEYYRGVDNNNLPSLSSTMIKINKIL